MQQVLLKDENNSLFISHRLCPLCPGYIELNILTFHKMKCKQIFKKANSNHFKNNFVNIINIEVPLKLICLEIGIYRYDPSHAKAGHSYFMICAFHDWRLLPKSKQTRQIANGLSTIMHEINSQNESLVFILDTLKPDSYSHTKERLGWAVFQWHGSYGSLVISLTKRNHCQMVLKIVQSKVTKDSYISCIWHECRPSMDSWFLV